MTAPGVDLLASATPLAASGLDMSSFMTLLLGNHFGVLGETCALALLIGGVYLVVRGVIKVTIPRLLHCGHVRVHPLQRL